jgi:translation initiation factor 2 subunit 2
MDYESMLKLGLSKVKKPEGGERFEMPVAEVMIQGNFTIIKNFSQLSSILRRDVNHMLKFFTKELAAPGTIEGTRAIFQTRVSQRTVQQKLESYVKEFVLCRECGKPDTKLIKEDRILLLKCEACGAKASVKQLK